MVNNSKIVVLCGEKKGFGRGRRKNEIERKRRNCEN